MPEQQMERRLFTMKEAAKYLGVSEATIARLGKRGDLEMIKIGDKATRVTQASLDRYIDERVPPRK